MRPKTCTTCHCRIEVGEWYWVQTRQRECVTIRRSGEVREHGLQPTHHFYCDDHEPADAHV